MKLHVSNHSSSDDPRFDAWFDEERGSSDDFDIESDVDDTIEDDYSDEEDEY
jgi:hypothetical protein